MARLRSVWRSASALTRPGGFTLSGLEIDLLFTSATSSGKTALVFFDDGNWKLILNRTTACRITDRNIATFRRDEFFNIPAGEVSELTPIMVGVVLKAERGARV